ncbi:hypothetical protein V8E53_006378 [Lactarius tabidus]
MAYVDLQRGRTSVVVENLDWASDGRWIAATKKCTVHISPRTLTEGCRMGKVISRKVALYEFYPLRLPPRHPACSGRPTALLAFISIQSDAHSFPKRLLPSPSVVPPPGSTPSSAHSSPTEELLSPPPRRRRSHFQDILLFNPANGSLSLRRCEINLRSCEQNLSVPSAVPRIGGTGISLPSRPSFGRLDGLGPKIEVRKEVEVSAYATGTGEAFIDGSHDTERTSSSFDEPLSSAMASGD